MPTASARHDLKLQFNWRVWRGVLHGTGIIWRTLLSAVPKVPEVERGAAKELVLSVVQNDVALLGNWY